MGDQNKRVFRAKTAGRELLHDKSNTIDDICRTLRVGRSTLYRCLAEEKRQ